MSERLVYGLWRDETFAVLDEGWARAALEEVRRWESASTNADAVALAHQPLLLMSPIGDPDELEGRPEESFSVDDCGSVGDGDWPGMPAQWSLDFIPAHWQIGEILDTTFNGEYLYIGPDEEERLLELAAADGLSMVRDDALINDLARWR